MSRAYISELEDRWLNAKARIAELEAEVARLIETNGYVNDANARLAGVRDARIGELEAELKMARLVFGKAVARHTNKDPDDLWDALMDEIRARPAP